MPAGRSTPNSVSRCPVFSVRSSFRSRVLPEPLQKLVEQLQKLPGIGAKSAQRLAFHVLKHPREDADRLIDAIRNVKDQVTYCSTCNNITDTDPCAFCT